ncbi:MAG: hypothetical protein ACXWKY_08495 [Caulobacteraceae bacterium]
MRNLTILGVLASAALLSACGSKTACFAMSDEDATVKVVAEFGKLSAAERGDPRQMQFSATRVVGVGRNSSNKGDGKGLTQVWFTQDDHTLTVATLTEDCQLQFRPGLAADAVKQAAIPVHSPNF